MKQQFAETCCRLVTAKPEMSYDKFLRDFGERFGRGPFEGFSSRGENFLSPLNMRGDECPIAGLCHRFRSARD
jgi:hypothetical protein